MRLKAHAKINWALNVTGLLPNGYHALDMLVQRLELADELIILPDDALCLAVEGNTDVSDGSDNLVYRAALALRAATGCEAGARLVLNKRVPSQAGLGGGSADAAATLTGLNNFWKTELRQEQLSQIAAGLGADVPLCLVSGLMRVRGFGEKVAPIICGQVFHLLILQPERGLSTKDVFKAYDMRPEVPQADIEECINALLHRNLPALRETGKNQLQPAAESLCAPVARAVSDLYGAGAGFAQMSGSGSAVFGVFESEAQAIAAQKALSGRWPVCIHTKTRGEQA